jgi:aryl-alcohol dehydrogenase-like predicted oxidoreductase
MRRRPLGKTGLEIPELALGTWGISGDGYGAVDDAERDRVIDKAYAFGIRLFETADAYGHGSMEETLGSRLADRSDAVIATKIGTDRGAEPPRKRFDPKYLSEAIDASRKRLGRDQLDIVLLHNPVASTVEEGRATEAMQQFQKEGRLRTWGVSAGSTDVARAAIDKGAEVIEVAYNVFFATDLHDLHDDIQRSGVGVLARSVLAHGLLCGYWTMHKEFPRGDHRVERWTPAELSRRVHQLQALRPLVGGVVYTLRAAALRFALSNDDVSTIVLGPRNAVQLTQLVREAGTAPPYLTEEKLNQLAVRLEHLGVQT